MKELVYVSGNKGKSISVKELFEKENINVEILDYDFEEPNINDIEYISHAKVLNAYNLVKKPCFVTDSGFYIEDYPNNPGYPGAFVKRSKVASDIDSLLDTMKNVKNRKCKFVDCLTFYDGSNFYTFYGICEGVLSYEKRGNNMRKAKSNLWYVFIPLNHDKTLAEMSDEEMNNRHDGHTSSREEFINWYKKEYLKQSVLQIK